MLEASHGSDQRPRNHTGSASLPFYGFHIRAYPYVRPSFAFSPLHHRPQLFRFVMLVNAYLLVYCHQCAEVIIAFWRISFSCTNILDCTFYQTLHPLLATFFLFFFALSCTHVSAKDKKDFFLEHCARWSIISIFLLRLGGEIEVPSFLATNFWEHVYNSAIPLSMLLSRTICTAFHPHLIRAFTAKEMQQFCTSTSFTADFS